MRPAIFSAAAILTALLSASLAPYLPDDVTLKLAADSVDDILRILASSMLSVVIFSLSIMVAAYSAATSSTTPRSITLLVSDPVAQNALATFIGVFLFGIVGIIGLTAGLYDNDGRIILFGMTLVVILIVTLTLLRWVGQLGDFGRVEDTIARVEKAAMESVRGWGRRPRLGARLLRAVPPGAWPVRCRQSGHLQHVDMENLADLAERHDLAIYLERLPGAFVHPATVLAWVEGEARGDIGGKIAACFSIGREREYDQDPRFGLVVLSEIASRALSPGINDPGTAIAVTGVGAGVLLGHAEETARPPAARFHRLFAPDIAPADLFQDFFNPIARDGAGFVEVQLRLQAVLEALALSYPDVYGDVAREYSAIAADRANAAMRHPHDRTLLQRSTSWAATMGEDKATSP